MNDLVKRAGERLETISPKETSKRLVTSLQSIFNGQLSIDAYDSKMTRPDGITKDQIEKAVMAIELSQAPARAETIINELKRLRAICKRRKDDVEDVKSSMKYVVEELQRIPADILLYAMREKFEWFPTASEIRALSFKKMSERERMRQTIKSWKPWTNADELEKLNQALRDYRFYSKNYAKIDPDRAKKFKDAATRVEKKIKEIVL